MKSWPPHSPVALRHADLPSLPIHLTPGCLFYPNEQLNEVLGTVVSGGFLVGFVLFFPWERKTKRSFMTDLQKTLPLPLLPPSHSSDSNLVKLNRETGEGGVCVRKKTCYNSLASNPRSLCTYYQSLCSCKKSGVSSMGWIWPIIFIPTEVPTEFKYCRSIKSKANRWPFIKK